MRACAADLPSGDFRLLNADALGPVDLALAHPDALVLGAGPLASPEVPGSHRLVLCGRSALWDGFYVSTLGSAALSLHAVGLDALVLRGRAPAPSALVLRPGRPPRLVVAPLAAWEGGTKGMLAFLARLADHEAPRVLAVGPGSRDTLYGAVASASGDATIDTWAGRGGFGSRLFQAHHLIGVVLDGGPVRPPPPAGGASAQVLRATQKYRYHPCLGTGGTLGANLSTLREKLLFMNARSVRMPPDEREALWDALVRRRYLAQHASALREPGTSRDCGEWCPAVCKKVVRNPSNARPFSTENAGAETTAYKKDFQPYAAFGPNVGVFDQRDAEALAEACDARGLDAVEAGALLAWRMECAGAFEGAVDPERNAALARALFPHLDSRGVARAARAAPPADRDRALFVAHGRGGMAPAQYWAPGMLAPVAVAGKYYVDYHFDWRPPRALGHACAARFAAELALDNLGICRFQREWVEESWDTLLLGAGLSPRDGLARHRALARTLQGAAAPAPPETARAAEFLAAYCAEVRRDGPADAELDAWVARFDEDPRAALRAYWEEVRAGLAEGLA